MSHEAWLSLDEPPLDHELKTKAFINKGRGKRFQGGRGRGISYNQTEDKTFGGQSGQT